MGRRRDDDEQVIGCVIYLMLIVLFMPVAGIYLLSKPSPDAKVGGWILLIIGAVLWAWIALS